MFLGQVAWYAKVARAARSSTPSEIVRTTSQNGSRERSACSACPARLIPRFLLISGTSRL
eukprot:5057929-Pleurochrysis_carterae.AAC.2